MGKCRKQIEGSGGLLNLGRNLGSYTEVRCTSTHPWRSEPKEVVVGCFGWKLFWAEEEGRNLRKWASQNTTADSQLLSCPSELLVHVMYFN